MKRKRKQGTIKFPIIENMPSRMTFYLWTTTEKAETILRDGFEEMGLTGGVALSLDPFDYDFHASGYRGQLADEVKAGKKPQLLEISLPKATPNLMPFADEEGEPRRFLTFAESINKYGTVRLITEEQARGG